MRYFWLVAIIFSLLVKHFLFYKKRLIFKPFMQNKPPSNFLFLRNLSAFFTYQFSFYHTRKYMNFIETKRKKTNNNYYSHAKTLYLMPSSILSRKSANYNNKGIDRNGKPINDYCVNSVSFLIPDPLILTLQFALLDGLQQWSLRDTQIAI